MDRHWTALAELATQSSSSSQLLGGLNLLSALCCLHSNTATSACSHLSQASQQPWGVNKIFNSKKTNWNYNFFCWRSNFKNSCVVLHWISKRTKTFKPLGLRSRGFKWFLPVASWFQLLSCDCKSNEALPLVFEILLEMSRKRLLNRLARLTNPGWFFFVSFCFKLHTSTWGSFFFYLAKQKLWLFFFAGLC